MVGKSRRDVAQGLPVVDLDATVAARFGEAMQALSRVGVRLSDKDLPLLADIARVNAKGTISEIESFAVLREWLASRAADFDPYMRNRLERVRQVSAADYMTLIRGREALVRAMDTSLSDLDGLLLPTTPFVAPTIAEVSTGFEAFIAKNTMVSRNTALVNFFDLCAISLPLPRAGGLPVGLMLVARSGQDRKLFRMAAAVERMFAA